MDGGDYRFTTKSGLIVANGYDRIVIGKRGPYIEFSDRHIVMENIYVPFDQKYRLGNDKYFYDEWRTKGEENVKIYNQKNTVEYADYRIGKWYISPDLVLADGEIIMLSRWEDAVEDTVKDNEEVKQASLFDLL